MCWTWAHFVLSMIHSFEKLHSKFMWIPVFFSKKICYVFFLIPKFASHSNMNWFNFDMKENDYWQSRMDHVTVVCRSWVGHVTVMNMSCDILGWIMWHVMVTHVEWKSFIPVPDQASWKFEIINGTQYYKCLFRSGIWVCTAETECLFLMSFILHEFP